ncbi:hypothetical protein GCM10009654_02320 [Streptomyces hebeiensis]|uniref:Uncharacterized protein n=1 Tax=Streptomyces hebeiensis TaxID=229486 RepID=A0ABN1UGE1_9ACTN
MAGRTATVGRYGRYALGPVPERRAPVAAPGDRRPGSVRRDRSAVPPADGHDRDVRRARARPAPVTGPARQPDRTDPAPYRPAPRPYPLRPPRSEARRGGSTP